MEKVKLLVGIGEDWDLEEVEIEAERVEQRGSRTLYKLADGQHLMHVRDEGCSELQPVSETGHKVITLEQALA